MLKSLPIAKEYCPLIPIKAEQNADLEMRDRASEAIYYIPRA